MRGRGCTCAGVGDALREALHDRPRVPPQLCRMFGQQVRQAAQPVAADPLAVVPALHEELLQHHKSSF